MRNAQTSTRMTALIFCISDAVRKTMQSRTAICRDVPYGFTSGRPPLRTHATSHRTVASRAWLVSEARVSALSLPWGRLRLLAVLAGPLDHWSLLCCLSRKPPILILHPNPQRSMHMQNRTSAFSRQRSDDISPALNVRLREAFQTYS